MFKGIKIKMTADFSSGVIHAGGQKGNILKSLKEKNINPNFIASKNQKTKPYLKNKEKVRHIPKENKNICPPKNVYTNVHSSIIRYGQKVEATQMPIN